jgi:hypothetical protein
MTTEGKTAYESYMKYVHSHTIGPLMGQKSSLERGLNLVASQTEFSNLFGDVDDVKLDVVDAVVGLSGYHTDELKKKLINCIERPHGSFIPSQ